MGLNLAIPITIIIVLYFYDTSELWTFRMRKVSMGQASAYLVDKNGDEGWGMQEGVHFSEASRDSLLEGVQYLWHEEIMRQNKSPLWRTVSLFPSPADARGYSGTVLCMGDPLQDETRAVVFQNFAQRWESRPPRTLYDTYIKGGFLLPPMVYNSPIECGPREAWHSQKMDDFDRQPRSL